MSVAKSSLIFSAGTFLSRISGLFRDSVLGAVFGASIFMDAFIVAFRIPNLLRDLLAEGALGSSFTKVYSSLSTNNPAAAERVLIQTLQLVVLISLCVCGLGILFAQPLVQLMSSATSARDVAQFESIATGLTQLLFPFIAFASIGAVVQGALYHRGGFFLAAIAPIAFNLFSIAGALWFGHISGILFSEDFLNYFGNAAIFGLAVGHLFGGAAQSGIQLYGIWRPLLKGRKLWPRSIPWSPETKKIFVLMAPMVIASSSGQVNVVVNTNFATSLEPGAVTWINFAFRLLQLPIGMFGVAVGAAVLPALARSITKAGGKVDGQASTEAVNAMDLVVWLMVPCMLFMHGSALDITRLLFQAGKFTPTDTEATAIAIQAYSLGLVGYGLLKVLNSYYYAVDRTRFPMMVSLLSIAVNYIGNAMLVKKYGHEGLAMTASITLTLNALILIIGTSADRIQINWRRVGHSLLLLTAAAVAVHILRGLYLPRLAALSISSFLSQPEATFGVKLDAALRLGVDGFVVVGIFGGVGLARIKKSPKDALRLLKRRPPTP